MSEHKPAKTLPLAVSDAALPQGSLQYLSGLPLLTAEDKDKYSRLHRDIFQAVEPSDFFEQLWVRDILQHVWEAERYRGFLVALIKGSEFRALENVLRPLVDFFSEIGLEPLGRRRSETLARQYFAADRNAVNEVTKVLKSCGIGWEIINADAAALRINEMERLNRMVISAEARRNATLREIERRRKAFGQNLRRVVNAVEDAEYVVVDNKAA